MKISTSKANLWDWVKSIIALAAAATILAKAWVTPVDLTVDFPMLLSLLLALFSVGLASLFYFKATETSNTFYDNTYKFTRDITTLLSKIESGFGERLRNLDEGYSSLRDSFQTGASTAEDAVSGSDKILEEKKEIQKYMEERNAIVGQLLKQSKLKEDERQKIAAELQEKDEQLREAQEELSRLKRRKFIERVRTSRLQDAEIDNGVLHFTKDVVIQKLGVSRVKKRPPVVIKNAFDELTNSLPRGYLRDLERSGFFDEGLTDEGAFFLKRVAETMDS
ncbi:hypothetical protein [Wenzhouxiangella sp. EGI_FJ10409]|uniref:hypothetical protein n=1 Tax=Wenzhouxiangella sp. EGI_FJ10409 TaxID=3243767 RepID=UPI0035D59B00